MPKVYLSEITATLNSNIIPALNMDSQESQDTQTTVTSFLNDSPEKLKGDFWDKLRQKMETSYSAALKTRVEVATNLAEAIKKALTLLKDYLGEDEMLDTDKLPEYKKQRQICLDAIEQLTAYAKDSRYNSKELQEQISQAKETLAELDRIIEKIEGLEPVYNNAMQILQEAAAKIPPFENAVKDIKPSGIFVYQKANSTTT
jgi:DNA repair exonuclease SbcCD ATPase subunit